MVWSGPNLLACRVLRETECFYTTAFPVSLTLFPCLSPLISRVKYCLLSAQNDSFHMYSCVYTCVHTNTPTSPFLSEMVSKLQASSIGHHKTPCGFSIHGGCASYLGNMYILFWLFLYSQYYQFSVLSFLTLQHFR